MTQVELANVLDMKPSTYSQMERRGKISAYDLIRIAKVLNVSVSFLLFGEEPIKTTASDTEDRYSFLDKISDGELSRLQKTIFYLNHSQRLDVYNYAYRLLMNK